MNHDQIIRVIRQNFPGLTPNNPLERQPAKKQTSFWIKNERGYRVVRIKKQKPWNLKRVASDNAAKKTEEYKKKFFDGAFLGTSSELIALVKEEIEILRTRAREQDFAFPTNSEITGSLISDVGTASQEMSCLVDTHRENAIFDPLDEQSGKTYIARSIAYRAGQASFRNNLIARYGGKCCISGCEIMSIVEAAHIVPFNGESTNFVSNGLLLRSDLHTLFDLGLLRIDPETYRVLLHATVLANPDYEKLTVEPLLHLKGAASKPALEAHFKRFAQT